MVLVLKVTDDDYARDAELRSDRVDPRRTDSCRDPWKTVEEPELRCCAVGFLLLRAMGRVIIADLLDDVVVGVDVPRRMYATSWRSVNRTLSRRLPRPDSPITG
jgi:hypothetical protein